MIDRIDPIGIGAGFYHSFKDYDNQYLRDSLAVSEQTQSNLAESLRCKTDTIVFSQVFTVGTKNGSLREVVYCANWHRKKESGDERIPKIGESKSYGHL